MIKYIKNLEDNTRSILKESLVDDAAELAGIETDVAEDIIKGLNFASYLELGNAVDIEDVETVREILSVAEQPVEEDVIGDANQGDLFDVDTKDMTDEICDRCAMGQYIETSIHDDMDGVLHCDNCGTKIDRYMPVPVEEDIMSNRDKKLLRYYATKHPGPYDDELDIEGERDDEFGFENHPDYDKARLAYFRQKFPAPYDHELEENRDEYEHDPTLLCSLCGGDGYDRNGNTCTQCGGQGRLTLDGEYITGEEEFNEDRYDDATQECMTCYGRGIEYDETCFGCGGKGRTMKDGGYIDDEWEEEMYALDQADLTLADLKEADSPVARHSYKVTFNNGKSRTVKATNKTDAKERAASLVDATNVGGNILIIGVKSIKELEEADNPSAKATPTQPAATPPSAGSSIDALAKPTKIAGDDGTKEMEPQRKEIDDLQIGDDIEVADIDGQPAAARIRNPNGPGNTLVVTGKGDEEHMIRKDSILSTPFMKVTEDANLVDCPECHGKGSKKYPHMGEMEWDSCRTCDGAKQITPKKAKQYAYVDEDGRLSRQKHKTKLGQKMKRADRIEKKKNKDVYEDDGVTLDIEEMRRNFEAALNERMEDRIDHRQIIDMITPELDADMDARDILQLIDYAFDDLEMEFNAPMANLVLSDLGREPIAEDNLNEGGLQFFVEPLANGIYEVRNSDGDIHDVYDSGEEAVRVAADLNSQYGEIDEGKDIKQKRQLKVGDLVTDDHGQSGEVRAFLDRSFKGTRVAKVRYYGSGNNGPEFFYVSVDQGNRMLESEINEDWMEDAAEADKATAEFNEKEWAPLGFKRNSNWPGGSTFVASSIDPRQEVRAKFKQEGWRKTAPEGGLSWWKHPTENMMSVMEFDRGRVTITSMPVPSYMANEARQGGKTEHSGAKKGKGGYYGRKKDAKADSNKNRRNADKAETNEAFHNTIVDGPGDRVMTPMGAGTVVEIGPDTQESAPKVRVELDIGDFDGSVFTFDIFSLSRLNENADLTRMRQLAGITEAANIACLKCDEVSTAKAWNKNGDTCPKCNKSTNGVAEQLNEVKSGKFNSRMIGQRVKIMSQEDAFGNNHFGEEGIVTRASREHTFSQMVPFKIEYGVKLDSGKHISIRRENVRKLKNTQPAVDEARQGNETNQEEMTRLKRELNRTQDKARREYLRLEIRKLQGEIDLRNERKVRETSSAGGTGAGAIASSPTAMGGVQRRNASIYGQTNLRKKPEPKQRPEGKHTGNGIGRGKKS